MQGTLQDFGLGEILQLVGMQHKTGLLRVEDGDKLLTFYFENGQLVSVRDRRRLADDPLLDYMKRTGWLDSWKVLHLKLEAEESRKDFADILLEKNILNADELHGVLEDVAQEVVATSYSWKQGSYRFLSGDEALRGLTHRIALNMEGLLLEAARRVDESPGLFKKIPGAMVLLDAVSDLPNWLDERAHALLVRLNAPMRMGELAACARIPEYEVFEIVAAALDAGLTRILEVPAAGGAAREASVRAGGAATPAVREKPRVAFRAPRRFIDVRPAVLVASTVFLCALIATLTAFRAVGSAPADRALATHEARARIVLDLEVYRALVGRYPEALDELSSAQLAGPEVQARAGVAGYAAVAHGETYQLRLGRDPQPPARRR